MPIGRMSILIALRHGCGREYTCVFISHVCVSGAVCMPWQWLMVCISIKRDLVHRYQKRRSLSSQRGIRSLVQGTHFFRDPTNEWLPHSRCQMCQMLPHSRCQMCQMLPHYMCQCMCLCEWVCTDNACVYSNGCA